jgi:hypothetical protein
MLLAPGQHASSHYATGSDPTVISSVQILDFLTVPTVPYTMQVAVYGGILVDNNGYLTQVPTQFAQLVAPTTEDGVNYYYLMLDYQEKGRLTLSLEAKTKSDYTISPPGISARYRMLALVRIAYGAERIAHKDITDLRSLAMFGSGFIQQHPLAVADGVHSTSSNLEDEYVDGHQLTQEEMDAQTEPHYPAANLAVEIENLRYMLAAITGETYWYEAPLSSIMGYASYLESINLAVTGRWSFAAGNFVMPVGATFPTSPQVGQIFYAENIPWVWNGLQWETMGASSRKVIISDDDSVYDYIENKFVAGSGIRLDVLRLILSGYEYASDQEQLRISAPGSHLHVVGENLSAFCDNSRLVFTTFNAYDEGTIRVVKDGVELVAESDYTESSQDQITLASAPTAGQTLTVDYHATLS